MEINRLITLTSNVVNNRWLVVSNSRPHHCNIVKKMILAYDDGLSIYTITIKGNEEGGTLRLKYLGSVDDARSDYDAYRVQMYDTVVNLTKPPTKEFIIKLYDELTRKLYIPKSHKYSIEHEGELVEMTYESTELIMETIKYIIDEHNN